MTDDNTTTDRRNNMKGDAMSAKCADCGVPMNEGEAATFTVCDSCWRKDSFEKLPTTVAPFLATKEWRVAIWSADIALNDAKTTKNALYNDMGLPLLPDLPDNTRVFVRMRRPDGAGTRADEFGFVRGGLIWPTLRVAKRESPGEREEREEREAQVAAMREALQRFVDFDEARQGRGKSPGPLSTLLNEARAALSADAGRSLLASPTAEVARLMGERDALKAELADAAYCHRCGYSLETHGDETGCRERRERDARELAEALNWTDEDVNAGLRATGEDPEKVAERGRVFIRTLFERNDARKEAERLRAAWRTINEPEKHAEGCRGTLGKWNDGLMYNIPLCPCTCGEHARKAEARRVLDGGGT